MDDKYGEIRIEEMIGHDAVLQKFEWLTAQMLGKWRREGLVRYVRGRDNKLVYPISDLNRALTASAKREEPEKEERPAVVSHIRPSEHKSPSPLEMSEADLIRERLFRKSLQTKWTKNKSKDV